MLALSELKPGRERVEVLGAHMSIAGGLHLASERASAVGCETMQVFTKNERQWKARELSDDEVAQFKKSMVDHKLASCFAHDTYLHNLASPKDDLWKKSTDAFGDELLRCERLGLSFLVSHPGSPGESGAEAGISRMRTALKEILGRCRGIKARILLETTAGQGATLGSRFEEMAQIIDGYDEIGVCLDTCHIFAAGYDIRTKAAYDATMEQFDRHIGLSRLQAFHVNDSKKDLGCRVDRHENIGKGCIGVAAFGFLMNDERFANVPKVIETPKEDDMDPVNLGLLRSLMKKAKARVRTAT